jgi:aspartate-semialdehyde dehydrogenase
MVLGADSLRIAIAGATSLRGKDLRQWIDESGFPAGEVRLLDEELAAGTLAEVAGEPVIVQPVDEASFERTRFVFFTGSPAFAAAHARSAQRAGATVIDMTGSLSAAPGARLWIPHLDAELAASPSGHADSQAPIAAPSGAMSGAMSGAASTPAVSRGDGAPSGTTYDKKAGAITVCIAPSAAAIVACSLSVALKPFPLARLAITFFAPVSDRGQPGVDELENQTVKLLSLQPMPQAVFDTQIAFTLLDRWGSGSAVSLSTVRATIASEVREYLADRLSSPAINLVHAPVFFGCAFSAYAEFAAPARAATAGAPAAGAPTFDITAEVSAQQLAARLSAAGFTLAGEDDPPLSNVSVAGESQLFVTPPARDPSVENAYWLWGAVDNLRLASANALRIAERLLVS